MPLIILSQYDPIYVDNSPENSGFSDTLSNQIDYVETLIEVIAFRDNDILNEILTDIHSWCILDSFLWYGLNVEVIEWETGFFDIRLAGHYEIFQCCLFDTLGMLDTSLLLFFFSDSELTCWTPYRLWDESFEFY